MPVVTIYRTRSRRQSRCTSVLYCFYITGKWECWCEYSSDISILLAISVLLLYQHCYREVLFHVGLSVSVNSWRRLPACSRERPFCFGPGAESRRSLGANPPAAWLAYWLIQLFLPPRSCRYSPRIWCIQRHYDTYLFKNTWFICGCSYFLFNLNNFTDFTRQIWSNFTMFQKWPPRYLIG